MSTSKKGFTQDTTYRSGIVVFLGGGKSGHRVGHLLLSTRSRGGLRRREEQVGRRTKAHARGGLRREHHSARADHGHLARWRRRQWGWSAHLRRRRDSDCRGGDGGLDLLRHAVEAHVDAGVLQRAEHAAEAGRMRVRGLHLKFARRGSVQH